MLELNGVARTVWGQTHIAPTDLALAPGAFNVLLGPTLSGKTSLLRVMAGLDRPTAGRVVLNGADVTGLSVRKRNVAMVYQQFVNYPTLTVFENIAAPLRVARARRAEVEASVRRAAALLELVPYLDRLPATLSGGQQQRVALARAVVKRANLVLLDEPLVNLDYKLREALREQLPAVFADSGAILVYASTEPAEALRLGGTTVTLYEGRVTQVGAARDVFANPVDLATARVFSDPPLNTAPAVKRAGTLTLAGGLELPAPSRAPDGACTVGIRPHHLSRTRRSSRSAPFSARVTGREITGNETFLHLDVAGADWVMHASGVADVDVGARVETFVDAEHVMLFAPDGGARLDAPA